MLLGLTVAWVPTLAAQTRVMTGPEQMVVVVMVMVMVVEEEEKEEEEKEEEEKEEAEGQHVPPGLVSHGCRLAHSQSTSCPPPKLGRRFVGLMLGLVAEERQVKGVEVVAGSCSR